MDSKLKEFCRQIKERIYTARQKASRDIAEIQEACHHPLIRETTGTSSTVCRICGKELTGTALMKQWEELLGNS